MVPVPDEASGELPRAYVVLKDDYVGKTSEAEIVEFVKERVAAYKRLNGGVEFTHVIPKSAMERFYDVFCAITSNRSC